ncbi:MAG TPA: hypothetical protein VIU85_02185 [Chthoniobacterales bacterium]
MRNAKRFWRNGFVLTMSILVAGVGLLPVAAAEPGPFEKFFRSVKRAFTEPQPQHKSTHHSSSHKQTQSAGNPSPSPELSPQASNPNANNPPSEKNTRSTTKASTRKGEDLPYGTPVAGKQGFVTSPFSPNSGYIDVRGFAPGTPVKDPYTGKVFLTP